MKKKAEYLLLAGVILSAIVYLMFRETDRTHYALPRLSALAKTSISRVEIQNGGKRITLVKKEDRWHILPGAFPADPDKTAGILDAVATLSLAARVSESRNYPRYGLDAAQKIHIQVFSGDAVQREFEIGSTASTFRHTHVTIQGDTNVYQALGNLRARFDQTVEQLRDLTVLAFKPEDVQELNITLSGKSLKLLKKNGAPEKPKAEGSAPAPQPQTPLPEPFWETDHGKPVDMTRLKGILAGLSGLKCRNFMEDPEKGNLRDPEMEILLKAKVEHSLRLYAKTDKTSKTYPATSTDTASPFFIADHQIQETRSFAEDLFRDM